MEAIMESHGGPTDIETKTQTNNANGRQRSYKLDRIVKNNQKLFEYYKRQPVIPEDEWEAFVGTLKIDLPSSFRIQMSLAEASLVDQHLHTHYFDKIKDLNNEQVSVPQSIPFVPYAYQAIMPRAVMRSHPLLKDLHEFLVNETEIGVISRQEAVSMVPPLLLDVQPEHMVLDACAAPGSKTMQLIELMHRANPNPSGLIVANDVDYSRCYLLVHQTLKRAPTANCVVVNQDGAQMPTVVDEQHNPVLFDRVLCDVICTGDGTFRKNPELWKTWDPSKALNLHRMQIHIAKRCLEMLKPGGRMVYSTCSLNPIEDEAVVAYLLRKYQGKVELVDVSNELPELKRSPGVTTWKVIDKAMAEYSSILDVADHSKKSITESMFPPTADEVSRFNLHHGFRILPHAQNSGGFYVAVLRKTEAFDSDCKVWRPALYGGTSKKRRRRMVREDPFNFLDATESADIRTDLETHYGVSNDFPYENMLIRSAETEKKKSVYYVNERVRQFMRNNENRFKVVNAGVGILRRVDKVSVSKYRLMQDGLSMITLYMTKRMVNVSANDAIKILEGSNDNHFVALEELESPGELTNLDCGSVVIHVEKGEFKKDICVWLGAHTVTAFITREEKIHCLIMLSHDPVKLRRQVQTTRQAKGVAKNQTAAETDSIDDEPKEKRLHPPGATDAMEAPAME